MSVEQPPERQEAGFTLVELLVVTLILGIVGAITATGVIRGMQTSAHAQDRVDALAVTQTAVERLSREMRVADPLRYVANDEVHLDVRREDHLLHFRYTVEEDGDLYRLAEERWRFDEEEDYDAPDFEPTEDDADAVSTRTLIWDLTGSSVFAYRDGGGEELDGDGSESPSIVRKATVQVERQVQAGRPPIEVDTTVTIRNR